jgi:hypothetical protein
MRRAPVAAGLAALLALAPGLVLPVLAARAPVASPAPVAAAAVTPPKVVIVVGATEGTTASYRADADNIAAEALKYTSNVIKLYSPNATWAMVKAAAQGASIFVYLGHGYGFPSPYRPVLDGSVHDGMGLNQIGGVDDNDKKYYGENLIASDIRFAKNAVVLLNHLCYSAGSSESGHPEPTIPVAKQRVDNFASGFIKAGARAVIAQSWTSGVIYAIKSIFTTNQTIGTMWNNAPNKQGHVIPFIPQRNPQFQGRLDPDTWTTGFHRSIVGALDTVTSDVVAGAAVPFTNGSPDDATPQLWSVDGPRTITPNFDGNADTLNLLARFSEPVSWTSTVKDADGNDLRTQSGTGNQAWLTWDLKVNGAFAAGGDYTWSLHATDAAGNPALDETGPFTIESQPTPGTGVLVFTPTTPTLTNSSTVNYVLTFAGPVTGLATQDFTRTGSAAGCVVGAPVGSGSNYTIAVTGCGTGSVYLYLNQGTVNDAALGVGPAGPITAWRVTIDRTAPKATTPKPFLRTGVALAGSSTSQALLAGISWTATDTGGAGLASYDVARSSDGGPFATIASATTALSMYVGMIPGHSYRFQVRARDKAGNVGPWVATSTWYPSLTQQTSTSIVHTGTWRTASAADYSGGSLKYASAAGASASFAFSGRAIGWVTTLRPNTGEVEVWIDGVKVTRIDTAAASTTYRQVAFSTSWSSYGAHTIKLVVLGTAGRPWVDFDALEIIR